MASVGEDEVELLKNYCKIISETLGPSVTQKLGSLIEDFDKQRISLSELRNSIPLLFDETGQEYEDDDTDLEEGEIREDRLPLRDEQAESNRLEGLKSGTDVGIRVSEERELEKHVTNGFGEMNLEGKKRRILQPEQNESSPKKTRTSKGLQQVTPTYKLITEEEQCPVKYKVLNNECLTLKQFDDPSGHKPLTDYEEAVARCEDDMYEANMLMEALKSAVNKAEKVIKEEMSVEDLGVKFYRCIELLHCEYCEDVFEAVRQDYKKALPVILRRLKQKLNELTVARKTLMSAWKQVLKENAAKQRDSTAMMVAELTRLCAVIDAELSPSEIQTLISLIEDFHKFRIGHREFSSSFQLLFERKPLPRGDPRAYTTESDRVTNNQRESDQVTPNYWLIPEEERDKASDDPVLKCLNNTCIMTRVVVARGHSRLTRYEEAMAECEDDMFKRDIEIGALTSAVDSAEKVLDEEMSVEDLGVMFYRCIQKLCRHDMREIVRQDHKQALPEILTKLKRKLSKLTATRERKKTGWKKTFEVNTAKQRELNAQILRKKQKSKQQI